MKIKPVCCSICQRLRISLKLLFLPILLLLSSPLSYAQASLVFNTTGLPPLNNPTQDGFMDEVTRMALQRIDRKLVISRLPAQRALHNANNGLLDAEMSRIKGIDKIYTNLVRVPEKIMDWSFVVISKKPLELQQSWSSLAKQNVAFITGWKILENNVPSSASITKTKNSQQLFRLLIKNRADFIIYERWAGNYLINQMQLESVKIRQPVLATRAMFMYLHKKHRLLVPKLAKALADMKKDGSYQSLVKKHLKTLLKYHK